MSDQNKPQDFSDYDVFLAHLNDSEDQDVANRVLKSEQGCQQLSDWQKDIQNIENALRNQQPDENYGAEVWNNIVDRLDDQPKMPLWQHLLNTWQQPRFSVVGLALMCVIALNFYLLGRNHGNQADTPSVDAYQQILAQNMRLHLAQTEAFLTQVSNLQNPQELPMLVDTAQRLLLSNRLYKTAVADAEDRQLPTLFNELEKVLIEVSNGHSPLKQQHLQDYTQQQLLFKVKSIRQQLASKSTPTLSI